MAISMSQEEIAQLKYNARDRDFIASLPYGTHVEVLQLKSGKWRAYLRSFVTVGSPRGQEAETKEVVRDGFDNIITSTTRGNLIARLKTEYPGWKWETNL